MNYRQKARKQRLIKRRATRELGRAIVKKMLGPLSKAPKYPADVMNKLVTVTPIK